MAGRGRNRPAARPWRRVRVRRHRHGGGGRPDRARIASFTLAVTSVTMALTPVLSMAARALRGAAAARQPDRDAGTRARGRAADAGHAIVVGYGRVGKVVCALLKEHGISYIAADSDAATVTRDRRDGSRRLLRRRRRSEISRILRACHGRRRHHHHPSPDLIDEVVAHVRAMRPDVLIVSRARDADHARHLYALGATDAVPETIEASLQLSEAALVGLGRSDRAGDRLDPRETRRDPARLAGGRARGRAGENSCDQVQSTSLPDEGAHSPPDEGACCALSAAARCGWKDRPLSPAAPPEGATGGGARLPKRAESRRTRPAPMTP